MVEIIGFLAAALTTGAAIPQVVKILKTKSTRDISLWYYLMLTTGIVMWLIYGIFLNNGPLIAANVVGLALNATVLGYKFKYK